MQVSWGGGMFVLLAVAVLLSTNRRTLNPRTVVGALIIQGASAFVVLYWDSVSGCCGASRTFRAGP